MLALNHTRTRAHSHSGTLATLAISNTRTRGPPHSAKGTLSQTHTQPHAHSHLSTLTISKTRTQYHSHSGTLAFRHTRTHAHSHSATLAVPHLLHSDDCCADQARCGIPERVLLAHCQLRHKYKCHERLSKRASNNSKTRET